MTTDKKLYAALGVLVLLGVAVWAQQRSHDKVDEAHSLAAEQAQLPEIAISEEAAKTVDWISITRPAEGDAGAASSFEFKKQAEEDWILEQPVEANANNSNIKQLIENMQKLRVNEKISSGTDSYERWEMTDSKATHVVVKAGDKVLMDAYFGHNGSRGQMTRVAGTDGVFAVKDFSQYLYQREAKDWRDRSVFKIEGDDIVKVDIQNEHGRFAFVKADGKWKGQFAKDGKAPLKDIPDFKESQVTSMVNAYKNLSAVNFGDDKSLEDAGLAEPVATLTLSEKEGAGTHVLQIGNKASGTNRWGKRNGRDQVYEISSWTAEWATAELSKFQEKKTEEKDDKDEG